MIQELAMVAEIIAIIIIIILFPLFCCFTGFANLDDFWIFLWLGKLVGRPVYSRDFFL